VTEVGIAIAAELAVRGTTTPPDGANAERVTVATVELPAVSVLAPIAKSATCMGGGGVAELVIVRVALVVTPFKLAEIVPVAVADTLVVVIAKFVEDAFKGTTTAEGT
jgi:hypothetical protein